MPRAAQPRGTVEPTSPASGVARVEAARGWRRPTAVALVGSVVCALAAWVSFGLLAVADDPSSARIGVLPSWWLPVAAGGTLIALAC